MSTAIKPIKHMGHDIEIVFIKDVHPRAAKGDKHVYSTSVAREFVEHGLAEYTGEGVGIDFEFAAH